MVLERIVWRQKFPPASAVLPLQRLSAQTSSEAAVGRPIRHPITKPSMWLSCAYGGDYRGTAIADKNKGAKGLLIGGSRAGVQASLMIWRPPLPQAHAQRGHLPDEQQYKPTH